MSWSSGLVPWLRPWAEELVRYSPGCRITSVYRSYSEQLQLYRTRDRRPYPVAPPGRSFHQLGRAWDMVGPRETLNEAGAIWRSWGGTWGGERDPIHFQA
ncbi:MAG: D-alanyl-D-alanine carboxypeptidase family protein, partial [Tepidisphaeraceae bacterium]